MAIPFTDREMERAWRENLSAFHQASPKSNALRLLLFYAVECGLKAVIMKRSGRKRTDGCQEISSAQHDINKLLDAVSVNGQLRLPRTKMCDMVGFGSSNEKRDVNAGQINQMWRYGGCSTGAANDVDLENKLLEITHWITRELR
jgi:hypothetical protein